MGAAFFPACAFSVVNLLLFGCFLWIGLRFVSLFDLVLLTLGELCALHEYLLFLLLWHAWCLVMYGGEEVVHSVKLRLLIKVVHAGRYLFIIVQFIKICPSHPLEFAVGPRALPILERV